MKNPISVELIQKLAPQLDSSTKLIVSDDPDYKQWISRWADNAVKPAGAVAVPLLETDVSKLVKFASDNSLDLAVRGGGHSTGGTSSTTGGLVIDLSQMRQVTIDADAKVIVAQGGALWEDIDNAAAKHGLATVGGTVNHTGIGGLTLGGGFGWLSGQYGVVIDNLLAARVVVADGRILTASPTENSDLFWGLRGAGHNFGVTVEFVFRAHQQINDVYAGSLVFTPDKLVPIVNALNERMDNSDPKGASMCVFAKPPDIPAPVVVVNVFYNGSEATAKEYFASVFNLEPVMVTAKMMPYSQVNGMLNDLSRPGQRRALKAVTFATPVKPEFVADLWEDYTNRIATNPDLSATFIGIEFYDLAKVLAVPLDSAAFANRDPYRSGILGLTWTDASRDDENRAWGRTLQTKCRNWILKDDQYPGSGAVIEYANYLEPGDSMEKDPFGANQSRLAALKHKFDPDCLFDKSIPITPLRP